MLNALPGARERADPGKLSQHVAADDHRVARRQGTAKLLEPGAAVLMDENDGVRSLRVVNQIKSIAPANQIYPKPELLRLMLKPKGPNQLRYIDTHETESRLSLNTT